MIMELHHFVMIVISFGAVRTDDIVIRTIKSEGYRAELHSVITDDGYILNVHRIRSPNITSKIALMMHGLQTNSFVFVYPRNSLAFELANNGYDVWIGNARGTEFSKNHQSLHANSGKFWDFSFHEIASYDLPSMIDHILVATNRSGLHYVGYSQGSTVIMALLALKPEYNLKMLTVHVMTPVVFIRKVLPSWFRYFGPIIGGVAGTMDSMDISKEIFTVDDDTRKFLANACNKRKRLTHNICRSYYILLAGRTEQWNEELLINTTELFQHIPNSISMRQLVHYMQLFINKRFSQYDFKHQKNLVLYNRTEPPDYNLRNIRAKIHIVYGTTDNIANYKDVEVLIDVLRPLIIGIDKMVGWNHGDFLVAKDVAVINKRIMKLMKQHSALD